MTRISAIINPSFNSDYEIKKSISKFNGLKEFYEIENGFLGISLDGPGGIAKHPAGTLLLDGLIYDLDFQKSVLNLDNSSDAYIIAERISRFGIKNALKDLNGDFALIWIPKNQDYFFAARDPFGQRPLYYARWKASWVFSSQPSGILTLENFDNQVNKSYLLRYGSMHYRMIDNIPDQSPYKNISQLEASTFIRFGYDKILEKSIYWELDYKQNNDSSYEELAEYYKFLLLDSTRLRLNRFSSSDIAFTLSGGMDSSSVLSCAVKIRNKPQICYSTLYTDPSYDERDDIKPILSEYVSDWRKVILKDSIDLVSNVKDLLKIHNEPVATATWLSHFELMKTVKKDNIKVLFGGLGGDELNAGEYEYFPFHFADIKYKKDKSLKNEIEKWSENHDHHVFRKNKKVAELLIKQLSDQSVQGKCLPDIDRLEKYKYLLKPSLRNFDFIPEMSSPFTSYLKNRTWQDLKTETLPCCLRAQDRNGSAFGIIHVLPFLDKRLVKFMFSLDGRFKIKNGVTKVLLREAMHGILPDETRNRIKKTGWNAPAHKWINCKVQSIIMDFLKSLEKEGIYDAEVLNNLFDEHISLADEDPYLSHMMILWPVINTILWQSSIAY